MAPELPNAAIGSASSSTDDSGDEAEQRLTTNASVPAPTGFSTSSEEDSDDDDEEAEQRPTTKASVPAPTGFSSSSEEDSDDEDSSSGDGDEDEGETVGSSNVAAKWDLSSPPHLQVVLEPQTPPEGDVPSPKLTNPSPVKRTAAAELAEPSSSKKKTPADAPSKLPPPEKPAAAGEDNHTNSSSSSEEDSSSGDEDEAEQRPTTNRSTPAPAGVEDSSSEEDSDSDDKDEGEPVRSSNVAAKQSPSPPPPHLQGVPEPKTPPEGDVPSPKLTNPSPLKRTAAAAELAEPSRSKKKAPADVPSKASPPEKPAAPREDQHTKLPHVATPAKEVTEKAVAAKKVAKLPEKEVAAKEVTKPPPRKKAAASAPGKKVTMKPPPSKVVAAVARQPAEKEVAYNAEKNLEEKRDTYWYLAEVLNALDREHNTPGLFSAAFLSIADDKAAKLNAKIKKQKMDEVKLSLKGRDIKIEVIRVMSKLIK